MIINYFIYIVPKRTKSNKKTEEFLTINLYAKDFIINFRFKEQTDLCRFALCENICYTNVDQYLVPIF